MTPAQSTSCVLRFLGFAAVVTCLVVGIPQAAHAQRPRVAGPPRFDVTLGGGFVDGVSLGAVDANLRANATTLQDYRFFSTDTRLRRAPVVDLRVAEVVTGRLAAELQVHFGKPELETAITNDVESAPDVTVSERLTQVLIAGGARVRLDKGRRPGDTMPYISGGAGLLRQTHEGGVATEQSPVFYVGGGVRHNLRSNPRSSARMGLRADVQLLMVKGGLSLADEVTRQLSVTGGVFFSF